MNTVICYTIPHRMYYQLFWIAAGLWNIGIATAAWGVLFKNNKTKNDQKLRALVFLFGVGYIMVGFFDWMWWIIVVGMAAKLGLVLDYFGSRFDFEKLKPDLMTYIMIGDLLWVFGFGAALGMNMSALRRSR